MAARLLSDTGYRATRYRIHFCKVQDTRLPGTGYMAACQAAVASYSTVYMGRTTKKTLFP